MTKSDGESILENDQPLTFKPRLTRTYIGCGYSLWREAESELVATYTRSTLRSTARSNFHKSNSNSMAENTYSDVIVSAPDVERHREA